jgi:transposase
MSDTFSKVEVITGVARRRRFSTEWKLAVVAERMQPGMSVSYVARRHGLSPSLVFRWRQLMSEGGKEAVRADDAVVSASAVRRLQERVRVRERLLGRKTMEVELLKEALDLARAKNRCCCRNRCRREVPGEDGRHDTRCGTLAYPRTPRWEAAPAWPAGASRRQ